MTSTRTLLEKRAALAAEMRTINDAAGDADLDAEQGARFDALRGDLAALEQRIARQAALDDAERRMAGTPLAGSGDGTLDRELRSFSLVRAIAAQAGIPGVDGGRERELSAEIARRSGRPFQGMAVPMSVFHEFAEQRALASNSGPAGGYLVETSIDGAQFVDRLRAALVVRRLGARVLSGLRGDLTVPRLAASASTGWVAENQPLTEGDPSFAAITLRPKHCGAVCELSRNMLLQPSVDVEALVRADFAQILADAVDKAAINGSGVGAEPQGILQTSGIGAVDLSTVSWGGILEFIADVETADAMGSAFAANPKTVKLLRSTLKVSADAGAGYIMDGPSTLAGYPAVSTTNIPANLGAGANKSALIFGDWSQVLLGYWSELDILVNPFESTAYKKGNVQVRAMLTMDVALRHPAAFSAATNIAAT